MKQRLFTVFAICAVFAQAQPGKEAWHWYFGQRAKLDFSTGVPVPGLGPTSFVINEGSASISDETTGQYLFSVGGTHIYNRNDAVMYNGYNISSVINSTQANLIIQQPYSTLYYVFSNDYNNGPKGIHYSIVDMSLQSGLGAVILKNQVLMPAPSTEKMVGVRHCNGEDYWVLAHPLNSNAFHAYLITSAGINLTPVISNVGTSLPYYTTPDWPGCGYIKASPNGRKLALGSDSDSIPIMELFDFDNLTGVVSNPLTINYPGLFGPYALSFSPDNSKLYAAPHSDSATWIYQYDLSSNFPSAIIASQTQITYVTDWVWSTNKYLGSQIGAMQIGPDGKIYVARYNEDTISVINNPNSLGIACNFQFDGQAVTGNARCGLPNFIDANHAGIQVNIPDVQQCNTFTATTLDAGPGFSNYFWSTGASTQTISINAPGKYWVTVTNDQGCTRTDTVNAYLLNPIKIDTLACDTFKIDVTQGGVLQYNWFDGSHSPTRTFTQSGTYYVDINYVNGCAIRDSINVTIVPSPQINIGQDTAFCKGELKMNASCATCTYQWSRGETSSSIIVKTPGTYSVKVKDGNGCTDVDTLTVKPQLSVFNFVMPNIVTPNDDKINDEIDFSKYQFSTFQIHIFNRWGQEIFKSEDPNAVWRPNQDDGTYYYIAQYKIDCTVDSQTKTLKGYVQVLR
ncbi:MAG: T9SS type B sorting domain-containing protein [Bacteroidia bacterium]